MMVARTSWVISFALPELIKLSVLSFTMEKEECAKSLDHSKPSMRQEGQLKSRIQSSQLPNLHRVCINLHSCAANLQVFRCKFAILILLAGCAPTVTPRVVRSSEASWDSNQQNSGFLGFDGAGNGILTPHAKARYDALLAAYGVLFVPPLVTNAGITPTATNTFLIDAEHLADFATMNRWRLESTRRP